VLARLHIGAGDEEAYATSCWASTWSVTDRFPRSAGGDGDGVLFRQTSGDGSILRQGRGRARGPDAGMSEDTGAVPKLLSSRTLTVSPESSPRDHPHGGVADFGLGEALLRSAPGCHPVLVGVCAGAGEKRARPVQSRTPSWMRA